MGSEARQSVTILVKVNDVDVTAKVRYADAMFMSQINGTPGECVFAIRDSGHDQAFVFGQSITLDIDGDRRWTGFVQRVRRSYSTAVDDTTSAPTLTRWFIIEGSDLNLLLHKRVVRRKAAPQHGVLPPDPSFADPDHSDQWEEGVASDDVLPYILEEYTDLGDDGITFTGIEDIGSPNPDYPGTYQGAMSVADFMFGFNKLLNGIYYITPGGEFVLRDVEDATTPYYLTDSPDPDDEFAVGPRELEIVTDATAMANDALVWGTAPGVSTITFHRAQDAGKQAIHGRWQVGEFNTSLYKPASVQHRAEALIDGNSPSRFGAKEPKAIVTATLFAPTFALGDVVTCRSKVFRGPQYGPFEVTDDGDVEDIEINLPVRRILITFPTKTNARFDLLLTQELDVPWSIYEFVYPKVPRFGGGGHNPPDFEDPHLPGPPSSPGGCSDAICGITETFNDRTEVGAWGRSDAQISWGASFSGPGPSVSGGVGRIEIGLGDGAIMTLAVGDNGNIDFRTTFQFDVVPSGSGNRLALTFDFGGDKYVYLGVSDDISEGEVELGGASSVDVAKTDWATNLDYSLHLTWDAATGDLKLNLWEALDPEPAGWLLETVETDPLDGDLEVGFENNAGSAGSTSVFFDEIDLAGVNRCSAVQFDDFNRTASSSWGVTTSGRVWSNPSGTGTYGVNGNRAFVTNGARTAYVEGDEWSGDFTMRARFKPGVATHNGTISFAVSDLSNYFEVTIGPSTATGYIWLNDNVDFINDQFNTNDWNETKDYELLWEVVGSTARAKVWEVGTTEPDWQVTAPVPAVSRSHFVMAINSTGSGKTGQVDFIEFDYDGKPCYVECSDPVVVFDAFDRTVASSGWGTSTDGHVWAYTNDLSFPSATTSTAYVANDRGVVVLGHRISNGLADGVTIGTTTPTAFNSLNSWVFRAKFMISNSAATSPFFEFAFNKTGGGNMARLSFQYGTGTNKIVYGVNPNIGEIVFAWAYGIFYNLVYFHDFPTGKDYIKIWPEGTVEPLAWTVEATTAQTSGLLGISMITTPSSSSTTDSSVTFEYLDFYTTYERLCSDVDPAEPSSSVPAIGPACEDIEHSGGTVFEMAWAFMSGSAEVWVNGLRQAPGTDYTQVGEAGQITLTTAIDASDTLRVCYYANGSI